LEINAIAAGIVAVEILGRDRVGAGGVERAQELGKTHIPLATAAAQEGAVGAEDAGARINGCTCGPGHAHEDPLASSATKGVGVLFDREAESGGYGGSVGQGYRIARTVGSLELNAVSSGVQTITISSEDGVGPGRVQDAESFKETGSPAAAKLGAAWAIDPGSRADPTPGHAQQDLISDQPTERVGIQLRSQVEVARKSYAEADR
jgi:hypothetical protein